MWAAHDDLWDKTFIEQCVHALEHDPALVLAMTDFDRFDSDTGSRERYLARYSIPAARGLYGRLKQHIFFYLQDGKGVPIYGLWRLSFIKDIPFRNDWDFFPVRFIFESLFCGSAAIIPQTLFFKRAPLAGRRERDPLFRRIRFTFADRLRKLSKPLFWATMRVIMTSNKLRLGEKMRLIFFELVVIVRLFLVRKT